MHGPQSTPELVRGADDEGVELVERPPPLPDHRFSGAQEHAQRLPLPTSSRFPQVLAPQGFAGGPDRIERIRLGAVAAGRPARTVDVDDALVGGGEGRGQTGPEAAGALEDPQAPVGRPAPPEGEQATETGPVGRRGEGAEDGARRADERRRVGLPVGVHPDDEIDRVCQHRHGCLLAGGDQRRRRSGRVVLGGQSCDGSRRALDLRDGQASDQATAQAARAGAGGRRADRSRARAPRERGPGALGVTLDDRAHSVRDLDGHGVDDHRRLPRPDH